MKILHLEAHRYSEKAMQHIHSIGKLSIPSPLMDQDGLLRLFEKEHFDLIFTRLGIFLGQCELSTQPHLKYIVTPTTGLNHIDVKAASNRNIKIISLKGEKEFLASIQSTAEHTWGLMLMLARNLRTATQSTTRSDWNREIHLADELNTQTLGIIGFGRLGKILYRYAMAFCMNVLLHDTDPSVFDKESKQFSVSLSYLFKHSDFIVLLIDYKPENDKVIDERFFTIMKPSAYFINTARGELISEQALLDALEKNQIKGAAIDVMNGDSGWNKIPPLHPLIEYAKSHNNLLITPHMGGYGKISITRTRDFITQKLMQALHETIANS